MSLSDRERAEDFLPCVSCGSRSERERTEGFLDCYCFDCSITHSHV